MPPPPSSSANKNIKNGNTTKDKQDKDMSRMVQRLFAQQQAQEEHLKVLQKELVEQRRRRQQLEVLQREREPSSSTLRVQAKAAATTTISTKKRIDAPHKNDVCFGAGRGRYMGNQQFKAWIRHHKTRYDLAPLFSKATVARKVMDLVRRQTPPGRFLERHQDYQHEWREMDDPAVVLEKTMQAFADTRIIPPPQPSLSFAQAVQAVQPATPKCYEPGMVKKAIASQDLAQVKAALKLCTLRSQVDDFDTTSSSNDTQHQHHTQNQQEFPAIHAAAQYCRDEQILRAIWKHYQTMELQHHHGDKTAAKTALEYLLQRRDFRGNTLLLACFWNVHHDHLNTCLKFYQQVFGKASAELVQVLTRMRNNADKLSPANKERFESILVKVKTAMMQQQHQNNQNNHQMTPTPNADDTMNNNHHHSVRKESHPKQETPKHEQDSDKYSDNDNDNDKESSHPPNKEVKWKSESKSELEHKYKYKSPPPTGDNQHKHYHKNKDNKKRKHQDHGRESYSDTDSDSDASETNDDNVDNHDDSIPPQQPNVKRQKTKDDRDHSNGNKRKQEQTKTDKTHDRHKSNNVEQVQDDDTRTFIVGCCLGNRGIAVQMPMRYLDFSNNNTTANLLREQLVQTLGQEVLLLLPDTQHPDRLWQALRQATLRMNLQRSEAESTASSSRFAAKTKKESTSSLELHEYLCSIHASIVLAEFIFDLSSYRPPPNWAVRSFDTVVFVDDTSTTNPVVDTPRPQKKVLTFNFFS